MSAARERHNTATRGVKGHNLAALTLFTFVEAGAVYLEIGKPKC